TVGDPLNGGYKEYYLRDAQGNIMAMYRHTNTGPKSLKVTERPIYGSKRIGSYTGQKELAGVQAITNYPYTQPMLAPLKRYELTDHLGNVNTVVTGRLLDGAGAGSAKQAEVVSAQGYEAFGSLLPGRNYSSDSYRFGFNGQEKDDEMYGSTGNSYDFGARMYDPRVGRWLSIDLMAAKEPGWSPYRPFFCNPIRFTDPTGMLEHTEVTANKDGTYTVSGGAADGDRNIYVTGKDGTKTPIGQSLTEYSFLNENGTPVIGAVINPGDRSGAEFLNQEITSNTPPLINYMSNATGGEHYDFKRRDMPANATEDQEATHMYRGMSFEGVNGFTDTNGPQLTFASARDIGNVAAGYMAGQAGHSWTASRAGFDALESYQQGHFASEGRPTQDAQRFGFNAGRAHYRRDVERQIRSGYPRPIPFGPK
ncbi:MAG: RHS repeat-associated core domain-containing protein, partial [Bacteroidetes bacterium]|nr:RHS repeat-associated core domain-containing protein [Bacteroidota bacterium]